MVVYKFTISITVLVKYQLVNSIFMRVKLDGFRCERCGHQWIPREAGDTPKVCPKCKNPYWDRPRRVEGKPKDISFKDKRKMT